MTVGAKVSWQSQAGGTSSRKSGKVVAVVPANSSLMNHLSGLQRIAFSQAGYGLPRNHESYVVHVPSKAGMGKLYWPRVSALKEIE